MKSPGMHGHSSQVHLSAPWVTVCRDSYEGWVGILQRETTEPEFSVCKCLSTFRWVVNRESPNSHCKVHHEPAKNYKICNVLIDLRNDMSQKTILCWEGIFKIFKITHIALAGVAQWIECGLRTKGSLVWVPLRAHVWVVGQVPSGGHMRSNHTLMFLFLSISLPSLLSKNK